MLFAYIVTIIFNLCPAQNIMEFIVDGLGLRTMSVCHTVGVTYMPWSKHLQFWNGQKTIRNVVD